MANAFGGHGETVCDPEDFIPAFKRAVASGKPSIIHCITDPQALTPGQSLDQIAAGARARQAGHRIGLGYMKYEFAVVGGGIVGLATCGSGAAICSSRRFRRSDREG